MKRSELFKKYGEKTNQEKFDFFFDLEFEFTRDFLKNRGDCSSRKVVEKVVCDRVEHWVTNYKTSDPIYLQDLNCMRVSYLYFTRLGAEVTK